MSNINRQFMLLRTMLTPTSISTFTKTPGTAWAMRRSNISESFTTRDMSWPVCWFSKKLNERRCTCWYR
jgi:hypothetical protein